MRFRCSAIGPDTDIGAESSYEAGEPARVITGVSARDLTVCWSFAKKPPKQNRKHKPTRFVPTTPIADHVDQKAHCYLMLDYFLTF